MNKEPYQNKLDKSKLKDKAKWEKENNKALRKLEKAVNDTNKKGGRMQFDGARTKDGVFILRPTFDI